MNGFRQFEVVIEIARQGSVSKAARTLNIAQPTLSKYLLNLEKSLGLELFDRSTKPIKLTDAGRMYVAAGNRICSTYERLEKEFESIKCVPEKTLKIGISPTRAHFILPELVKAFYKLNTGTKLTVKEKNTTQLNAGLLRGELDLIISFKYDGTNQFDSTPLFKEKVLFAVPKKYKGNSFETIMKECQFITTESGLNISNMLFDILCEYKREEPKIEVQSIESAMALTSSGIGVSLVPSYVKNRTKDDNVFFMEIPQEIGKSVFRNFERQVCIFYKRDVPLEKAQKDFIKACENSIQSIV